MAEVITSFGNSITELYNIFLSGMPSLTQKFINLSLIVLIVVLYSILIWKFYRWISKREIFQLNLWIKSRMNNPGESRFLGGLFYIVENIILLPIVIFIWFLFFTLFLFFLTENISIDRILVISTIIITAIRMTAYYNEDLSKDLAKLLPFTLLAVFLTQFGVFNFSGLIANLSLVPNYFSEIGIYFIFIFAVEFVLTIFDLIFRYLGVNEEEIRARGDFR